MNSLEIDDFLLNALQSPVDRPFILKVDRDLGEFIEQSEESEKYFFNQNGYRRMIIHKIAHYFGLSHMYAPEMDALIVFKEEGSAVPVLRMHDFAEFPKLEEKMSEKGGDSVKSGFRPKVLKRPAVLSREEKPKEKVVPEPAEEVFDSSSEDYETKALAYEEARAKIFSGFEAPDDDETYHQIYNSDSPEEIPQFFDIGNEGDHKFEFNFGNITEYSPYEPKPGSFSPSQSYSQPTWNPERDPILYGNNLFDDFPQRNFTYRDTIQQFGSVPLGHSQHQRIMSNPSITENSSIRTLPSHMLEVVFLHKPITKPVFERVKQVLKSLGCRLKKLENNTLLAIFKSSQLAFDAMKQPNNLFTFKPAVMRIAGNSNDVVIEENKFTSRPEEERVVASQKKSTYSYF
eukprot:TRINITY_DN11865_c0_g1_i1.p1 TRINITY_DN11865_c0_g1~~TRINITY_DN11865_c0_g1_i1.p1  ORF type:complete len:417 (-),score=85.87 TRINITY_DN11865_c0_g1_i1:26-1231(-)